MYVLFGLNSLERPSALPKVFLLKKLSRVLVIIMPPASYLLRSLFLRKGGAGMKDMQPFTPVKSYTPFHSRFDPCPPIGKKYYRTPPNLYMTFQPEHMEQFSPMEALRKGTLWKDLYDFYENPYRGGDAHGKKG